MSADIPNNVNIVQPGFMAPEFNLQNVQGGRFDLKREIVKGPLVLNFYAGGWSFPCVAMLKKIGRLWPEFAKRGGQFAAVSPESLGLTARLAKAEGFAFPLLVDADLSTIRRYGILNSKSERPAPYPAFWVIDQEGIIRFKRVIVDEKDRLDIDVLLNEIEKYKM